MINQTCNSTTTNTFEFYNSYHTHPINKFFHLLGIPSIMLSTLLLLRDFYIGYYVQILKNNGSRSFTQSGSIVNKNNPGCMCPRIDEGWFYWLRLVDKNFDGSLDIVVDDAWRNLIWINSGSGSFSSI